MTNQPKAAGTRWKVAGAVIAALVVVIAAVIAVGLGWPALQEQSGREAYDLAQLGTTEAEVLSAITMPSSPHGIYGLERLPLDLAAEDGNAHFATAEVGPEFRSDGAVGYRSKVDGQVVGWARWWDTPRHNVVVIFGPDGRVIGRSLYEDRAPRRFWPW